jgi:hypothetical protein
MSSFIIPSFAWRRVSWCAILTPFVLFNSFAIPSFLQAEPSHIDMEASTNPTLLAARRIDPAFVGVKNGNRAEAERTYLKFIQENSDSELVPYVYSHLGRMYSSYVDPDWALDSGLQRDHVKAYGYFRLAVETHPTDKSSDLLIESRINAASIAPARDWRIKQYLNTYHWLKQLTFEGVTANLWLSKSEAIRYEAEPNLRRQHVEALLRRRNEFLEVIRANVNAIADSYETKPAELLEALELISSE